MSQRNVSLVTVSEIAETLEKPLHRIQYVIRARKIAPSHRAGNSRLFDAAAVRQIDRALQAMDARKGVAE